MRATQDAKAEESEATAAATTNVTSKPDRKPLTRLSAIARPGQDLAETDVSATATKRPSLRKALGINGHPVRDFAESVKTSVRRALGAPSTDNADNTKADAKKDAASTPAA